MHTRSEVVSTELNSAFGIDFSEPTIRICTRQRFSVQLDKERMVIIFDIAYW